MASNLGSVGLGIETEEDYRELVDGALARVSEEIACPPGLYAVTCYDHGGELWVHLATGDDGFVIDGVTPFHRTENVIPLRIDELGQHDDDNPFEGRCYAWVGNEDHPFSCELVDYAVHAATETPLQARLAVIGLAHSVTGFEDEAAFTAAQDGEMTFAPNFFIPTGLFAPEDDEAPTGSDRSMVWFAGTVRKIAEHRGRTAYRQISVESLAATYDVFAEADIVTGPVVVGGIVEVSCRLFGRLLDSDAKGRA